YRNQPLEVVLRVLPVCRHKPQLVHGLRRCLRCSEYSGCVTSWNRGCRAVPAAAQPGSRIAKTRAAIWAAKSGGRLARLQLDVLALVPTALALVRLRLAQRADFRGKLPYQLLVATLDHNVRLVRTRNLQALGHLLVDLVGKSQPQRQGIAFQRA